MVRKVGTLKTKVRVKPRSFPPIPDNATLSALTYKLHLVLGLHLSSFDLWPRTRRMTTRMLAIAPATSWTECASWLVARTPSRRLSLGCGTISFKAIVEAWDSFRADQPDRALTWDEAIGRERKIRSGVVVGESNRELDAYFV